MKAFRTALQGRERLTLLFALVTTASLCLGFPALTPDLEDLNLWDECYYIQHGKNLVTTGHIPQIAEAPLLAVFYATPFVFFRESDSWLLQTATAGRVVIALLLWLSFLSVLIELERWVDPRVALCYLLVTPVVPNLLSNSSDGLFACLTGAALSRFLRFLKSYAYRNLAECSSLVGLGALARNDGVPLFMLLLIIASILSFKRGSFLKAALAVTVPFGLVVTSMLLLRGASTGDFNAGIGDRLYFAFTQGQVESDETNEELRAQPRSVVEAIRSNPQEYRQRLRHMVINQIPQGVLAAYGGTLGIITLALLARGMLTLARGWEGRRLLAVLMIWPSGLVVYFITFFRPGYFLLFYYVALSAAAIGLLSVASSIVRGKYREVGSWTAFLAVLVIVAFKEERAYMFVQAAVLLIGLVASTILVRIDSKHRLSEITIIIGFFLAAALAQRGFLPEPTFRDFGDGPAERASLYMRSHLPPDAVIGAVEPGIIWSADRTFLDITKHDIRPDAVDEWIEINNIVAFCFFARNTDAVELAYDFIPAGMRDRLKVGFSYSEARLSAAVLLVIPKEDSSAPGGRH